MSRRHSVGGGVVRYRRRGHSVDEHGKDILDKIPTSGCEGEVMDAYNWKVVQIQKSIRGDKVKTTKYKYTCVHCRTGMVMRLPAVCPECERLLTKEA